MHILAILGSILTILYMLDRLGVDIGWLNPFHWRHRRKWAKKYESDPIYSVEDPVQVAALIIVGAARLDGDASAECRRAALEQFRDGFSIDEKAAGELWTAASHLLGGPQVIDAQLDGVVSRNASKFSPAQVESMLQMLVKVASADGELSAKQQAFIGDLRDRFETPAAAGGTWA